MTSETVSLSSLLPKYLATLPLDRQLSRQGDITRLASWYGKERPMQEMLPADVEGYMRHVSSAGAVGMAERLENLKAFLNFAHKQNVTRQNLASHVKVRASSRRVSRSSAPTRNPRAAHLSAEGLGNLQAELDKLQEETILVSQDIHRAAADKDVRENAPLEAARERQGYLEARIRELQVMLRTAVVLEEQTHLLPDHMKRVLLGSSVSLESVSTGRVANYKLVDTHESSPGEGRLSEDSPVGQAILNKAVGDEVIVTAPRGMVAYRITHIGT